MFSGLYFLSFEYFPEDFRRFFLQADDMTLQHAQVAFRLLYNHYFGDEDYYLTESEYVLEAALRPMIQTIEIVGDDELELTWEDFVEFQTGFRPMTRVGEMLSWRISRAGRMLRAGSVEDNVYYSHHIQSFSHSVVKNHVAGQGGVVMWLLGNWSNPILDGGGVGDFTINRLTNRDDWIIREMDEDSDNLGQLSSSQAAINLFEGGEIYVPNDAYTDLSGVLDVATGDVDVAAYGDASVETSDITESTMSESSTRITNRNFFYCDAWIGGSFLTDINFF